MPDRDAAGRSSTGADLQPNRSRERTADDWAGTRGGGSAELYGTLRSAAARSLRAFGGRFGPDPDLADDVAVRAMRGLAAWRGDCAIRTWIFRIVCRELARRGKAERRAREMRTALTRETPPAGLATPEDELARRDRYCRAAAALALLPERRRLCMLALDVWELSAEETAVVFSASAVAVRVAATKARQRFLATFASWPRSAEDHAGLPECDRRSGADPCTAADDGWLSCRNVVPVELAEKLASALGAGRGSALPSG